MQDGSPPKVKVRKFDRLKLGANQKLIPFRNLHHKAHFKTLEQIMMKSPSMAQDEEHQAEVGSVIRRERNDQSKENSDGKRGMNQQLDEEFKQSDIRYMEAKDRDLIKRVLADCNYIDKKKLADHETQRLKKNARTASQHTLGSIAGGRA